MEKKGLIFVGSSLDDLKSMPADARQKLGTDLLRVQFGGQPVSFKPMQSVGKGVYEARVRADDGTYRAFYVALHPEAVYVLHAFQKKSEKTSKPDIELGKRRYADMLSIQKERGP